MEFGKISSIVVVMEGPPSLQTETTTHKQSLASTKPSPLTEASHTEQQNLLEANHHDTADGAEPQTEDVPQDNSMHDWGECQENELLGYDARAFWETESDSADRDARPLSATIAKIMQDAFCHFLKPDKLKSIKMEKPFPDTLFTEVPKLDITTQSRMSAPSKTDRSLAGMQSCVLDAAIPRVNILKPE